MKPFLAAIVSFAVALGAVYSSVAHAQTLPAGPIRVVVGFSPGGPTDIMARTVAQAAGDALGQSIIVQNKPGASGMIGAGEVARAAPDGRTLLVNASIHVINPSLFSSMPFDAIKDFTPITQLVSVPLVLVVNPAVPATNLRELIALAKASPGKLTFASSSSGGAPHLAGELFKSMTGTDIVHVPYKGSAPAVTDLLGGQVTMAIDSLPSLSAHIKSGRLRALAVSTKVRLPSLPDVPTIDEAGVPGYEIDTWYGVWAPPGLPPALVEIFQKAFASAVKKPEVVQRLGELGALPVGSSAAQFGDFNRSELERWAKLVKQSGAKAD